jgi:hypothetical protein
LTSKKAEDGVHQIIGTCDPLMEQVLKNEKIGKIQLKLKRKRKMDDLG